MQLKQIKIAGFKSFADPVTFHMPRAIAGIVGPNGSGKSNVIDAMRWVVGESSAKSLRGETLDDVIFNGSEERKPAARASVELLFDNSLNRCPPQWSKYAEISIRRIVTRDGISEYFINNTRTRRKDVKELFLGTGFGPRSYAIIEQGMVSRIVEGKPEELSAFIEEASGVSRFREKRHETLLKLNRTQENLKRLDDMRAEVETRVKQLKYQSEQAQRYRKLKENATRLRARLLAVEWRNLTAKIEQAQFTISQLDIERNKRMTNVRAAEAEQESARKGQLELQVLANEYQMEHYRVNAEIANLERQIKECGEKAERDQASLISLRLESEALDRSIAELKVREQNEIESSQQQQAALVEVTNDLASKTQQLNDASTKFALIQTESENIDRNVVETIRRHESLLASLEELQRRQTEVDSTKNVREEELTQLRAQTDTSPTEALRSTLGELSGSSEQLNQEINITELALNSKRAENDRLVDELDQLRYDSQDAQVRLKTLERSLQEAQSTELIDSWLADKGLDQAPALSSKVDVQNGWERALDRVMGDRMSAVVVSDIEKLARESEDNPVGANIYFVESGATNGIANGKLPALAAYVESRDHVVENMIGGVYTAESLDRALAVRHSLHGSECAVTPEGAVIGANWFSPAVGDEGPAGVMETASLIARTRKQVVREESSQQDMREIIENNRLEITALESTLANLRQRLSETDKQAAEVNAQLAETESNRIRTSERLQQLLTEVEQLKSDSESLVAEQQELQLKVNIASQACVEIDQNKTEKSEQLKRGQGELKLLQDAVNETLATKHQLELEVQKRKSDMELLRTSIVEKNQRLTNISNERQEIESRLAEQDDPIEPLKAKLNEYIEQNRTCEDQLSKARNEAEATEVNYRELDQARLRHQLSVEEVSAQLEAVKVDSSAQITKVAQIRQKIEDFDSTPEQELEGLGEDFDPEAGQIKLERLLRRIDSFGGVNLIAVTQYEEEKQRKEYMDNQHDDLSRAIETLSETIRKIDQESREQYTEMFNMVNSEYQRLLPVLFGGGSGHLELLGEYPESAGIRIYARPKGKRIHNIQALSGGEKALTAIALLLAFFRINPAPVCLLDEIDAPLDDENVYRLCSSLRDLAETTQLILITHNKITMESVDSLIGVTMPEPNISRILSVDLQEAQEFAA